MKKAKRFYYRFWLVSSGQSDHMIVRSYDTKQDEEHIKEDLQDWVELLPCWNVGSSKSYGWEQIPNSKLPKNRKECLTIYDGVCKQARKWKEKQRLYAALLGQPPFDGSVK